MMMPCCFADRGKVGSARERNSRPSRWYLVDVMSSLSDVDVRIRKCKYGPAVWTVEFRFRVFISRLDCVMKFDLRDLRQG